MIGISLAADLLDFGSRIGPGQRATEQLEGAVALHNILCKQGIAYLADEVGMGKTLVALGTVALFRHFNPQFRVLVVAPRGNIQQKWIKELRNFVMHNVRFSDLRVKGVDGAPVRELVPCDNLTSLVRETSLNPDRDFFCRMTSFSLPVGGEHAGRSDEAARLRGELLRHFPWLPREIFDLREKRAFKENVARAICCVLPKFDLVIVDEGHNLKHGFDEHASARNRVLGLVFGHPAGAGDGRLFKEYGSRFGKLLLLSATPVEDSYTHLWNQLDVFGRGDGFEELTKQDVSDDRKRELVGRFLVRRVTEVQVNGRALTKNLYRREWRNGGVDRHDEPVRVNDAKERLVVALVQKKVSELLQEERFGNSFQIGMLASFESFLETARLKRDESGNGNFDDAEQTEDATEREGIDVTDVNRIARSYRGTFGKEMPHPKMDAVVARLAQAWITGQKSLVFVRRVASVKELKRKLDEKYDEWLLAKLRAGLPQSVQHHFGRAVEKYRRDRLKAINRGLVALGDATAGGGGEDLGGTDSFFAWFLRGRPRLRILSGGRIRDRHSMPQSPFFEDNYAAVVLNCAPGEVLSRLAALTGREPMSVRKELGERSRRFLRSGANIARGDRFEAVQAAAVEWCRELDGSHRETAEVVWHERFEYQRPRNHSQEPPEVDEWLECRTFFTELRRQPELRSRLWPEARAKQALQSFRDQEIRARMLAAAARLGHAFIDLYALTVRRIGSLRLRAGDSGEEETDDNTVVGVRDFLSLLDAQMRQPLAERDWGAFDELAEVAAHFDLILDVNAPDARTLSLGEVARRFGTLLSRQQPAGGMAGQVSQTLVGQFRMPGYPLVLVTTDLLQEGEDLHTFCSSIHHYGISWTPSSMEQRIGRIDRVRSQSDRRLSGLAQDPKESEKLQVYFPHLQDTIEVLQVQRVLARMNTFLRLMHEGLINPGEDNRQLDLVKEMAVEPHVIPQIQKPLHSAFRIQSEQLEGHLPALATNPQMAEQARERFKRLATDGLPGLAVTWELSRYADRLFGTAAVGQRRQPFSLLLRSYADRLLVKCISPVGRVSVGIDCETLQESIAKMTVKVGAIPAEEERTYDLTVEDEVLLSTHGNADGSRVACLVRRVTNAADELERIHLPGLDQPLETFMTDLEKEMDHG